MAYAHKAKITVPSGKVASTLTNFPLLVRITDPRFRTVGNGGQVNNASGHDIGFFSDEALTTPLSWDLVGYTGTDGVVVAHVRIPSLSHSADNVLWIAWGDPGISTYQSVRTDVYTSAYRLVLNFDESSGNLSDRSGAGNSTTGSNGTPVYRQPGKIRYSVEFDRTGGTGSTGERFNHGNFSGWSNLASGHYTHSLWFMPYGFSTTMTMFRYGSVGVNGQSQNLRVTTSAGVEDFWWGSPVVYAAILSINNWHLLHTIYDGSVRRVYLNGALLGSDNPAVAKNFTAVNTTTGSHINGDQGFNGRLELLRSSEVARSGDWVVAEYDNQNDPESFITVDFGGSSRRIFLIT